MMPILPLGITQARSCCSSCLKRRKGHCTAKARKLVGPFGFTLQYPTVVKNVIRRHCAPRPLPTATVQHTTISKILHPHACPRLLSSPTAQLTARFRLAQSTTIYRVMYAHHTTLQSAMRTRLLAHTMTEHRCIARLGVPHNAHVHGIARAHCSRLQLPC